MAQTKYYNNIKKDCQIKIKCPVCNLFKVTNNIKLHISRMANVELLENDGLIRHLTYKNNNYGNRTKKDTN